MTFNPHWSASPGKDPALTIVEERIFTITHESETWRLIDRGEAVPLELSYTNDAPERQIQNGGEAWRPPASVITMPRAAFITLARALAPQGPTVRAS